MTPEEALLVGAEWQTRGVPAFPVAVSWNESKGKCDKRPLTEHGHSDATLDPEVLAGQIAAKRPKPDEALGIGLRPGAGGFVIFDGDVIHDRQAADGPGYLLDELKLPPYSYTTSTGSGGVHRWYRKRDELVEVTNVPTWEPHGIEVRSDRGWVVAPGTVTPWGTWERAEGSPDWPTVATIPERVWIELVGPMPGAYAAPGSTSSSSKAWQRYRPEHDEQLHPSTREVLRWLCSPDREHPVDASLAAFRTRTDGDPYLDLVRPGKTAGTSATLGYIGPGVLKVWSSNWPGLASGVWDMDKLDPLVEAAPEPAGERKPSTRDRLVALALERFRLGRSQDERVFIVEHDGANLALLAAAGKARLAALAYETTGAAVGRTPLEEAWQVIEGMAAASGKEPLPLRVADHDSGSVLDLGRPDGHAVLVTAGGWEIVARSPVTFRRSKAGLGLPTPTAGGSLEPLWDVVNVPSHHRGIIRAWLAAALIRGIPHPIVQVRGEQGAAKTTATRYLGAVLDPCAVDTLAPPRDAESWAATASARWLLPVDNVSRIEPWWSDDLCRTATGAGTLKRTLYSDDDVTARLLRGCVILNGISLTSALRSDLAERLLPLDLVRPSAYMTESQVSAHFDAHHAGILGAVLDDAVTILARRPTVTAPHDLRMADFALALAALDAGTDLDSLTTYRAMHDEAAAEALEGDALALAVLEHMDGRTEWRGSAADLRKALTEIRADLIRRHLIAEGSWWPGDGAHLSGALTRSGPLLRANGIDYERQRDMHGRVVRLWTTQGESHDAAHDAAPPTGGSDSRLHDANDANDAAPPVLAFSSESRERDRKRNKGGAPSSASWPSSPSSDAGALLDLLSPCSTCGQPNVTDPCATCRRSA